MPQLSPGDFLALFYFATALVWLRRSRRAFETHRDTPEVRPVPPSSLPPLVSILIPVRNEEVNVEACLNALLVQDYPSQEIIVINDNSIDRTPELLGRLVSLYPTQIRVVNAPPVPAGWTGKNWALAQGVPQARGDWFLFTDADTRHEPCSVSSAVSHAKAKDLDLLTLTPRCLAEGFWEKTLQPTAMAFTGLLFPPPRVNDPRSPLVFGNGQYLLMHRKAYQKTGGHEKVKAAFLEDFELVRQAKTLGLRIECALGTRIYGTRMYRSLGTSWRGWRRIFLHALLKNPGRLFAGALGLFLFSFLPFLLFPFLTQLAFHDPQAFGKIWGASFPILALILLTLMKAHGILGVPRRYALLHPLAGGLLAGILADAARAALQKEEQKWR